jgi:hypothetical protein
MATIRKHYGSWQALIRISGHPHMSKSFSKHGDAKRWAIETELKIRREDAGITKIKELTLTIMKKSNPNQHLIIKINKLK